jgi:hypothetical protein
MVRAVPVPRLHGLGLALVLALSASCSLLLDNSAVQCHGDSDCARFGSAMCNTATHLCVPKNVAVGDPDGGGGGGMGAGGASGGGGAGGSGAGDAGILCHDQNGCHPCLVGGAAALLNACTDGTCIPFDNASRLTNMGPNGTLKPLPSQ